MNECEKYVTNYIHFFKSRTTFYMECVDALERKLSSYVNTHSDGDSESAQMMHRDLKEWMASISRTLLFVDRHWVADFDCYCGKNSELLMRRMRMSISDVLFSRFIRNRSEYQDTKQALLYYIRLANNRINEVTRLNVTRRLPGFAYALQNYEHELADGVNLNRL